MSDSQPPQQTTVMQRYQAPLTLAGATDFHEVRRGTRMLLLVIAGVVFTLLLWAAVAEVETVTRAEGKVIPSARLQLVQSLEGGIVESIRVQQGQQVRQGEVLATLSAAQVGADLNSRNQQQLALQAKVARLTALAEGSEPQFDPLLQRDGALLVSHELAAFRSQQMRHTADLAVLDAQLRQRQEELSESRITADTAAKTLRIAQEERTMVAEMVQRGLEPKLELVRLERVIADAAGRAAAAKVAINRIEAAIVETESRRQSATGQFRAEALVELNQALAELQSLEQALPALRDKVARTELRAPVAGVVNRLLVATIGGVVAPGEPVVEIVPIDEQLLIEALVQPKDIAFIGIGHPAKVKISAYDYAIYGALDGRVTNIGADVVTLGEPGQPFYQVRIETDRNVLESLDRELPMMPGMQAQVDIITGSRTVLQYLTKPLVGVKENAFRER